MAKIKTSERELHITKPDFKKLHLKFDNSCKHSKEQPANVYALNTVERLKAKLIGYKHDDFVQTTLAKYELA